MPDRAMITHFEIVKVCDNGEFILKPINAKESTDVLIRKKDYVMLARLATNGRIAHQAYKEQCVLIKRTFEIIPEARDAYYRAGVELSEKEKK